MPLPNKIDLFSVGNPEISSGSVGNIKRRGGWSISIIYTFVHL